MINRGQRYHRRHIRHIHVRRKVSGGAARPRLCVFRSGKHIYAQAIDDDAGRTLAAASTMDKTVRKELKSSPGNMESAKIVGQIIAQRLTQLGVDQVVFDRGGNHYHGRVKALADSAREAGLKF